MLGTKAYVIMAELLGFTKPYVLRSGAASQLVVSEIAHDLGEAYSRRARTVMEYFKRADNTHKHCSHE